MQFKMRVPVNASKEEVWNAITDFDTVADRISGIEEIEILNKPPDGLVGLKWKETRTMFGKTATETMWITDAVENDHYDVEARSHGSIYRSRMYITDESGKTELGWDFDAEPQTIGAKILSATMGFMFKGATEKALAQDLADIKASLEITKAKTREEDSSQ